MAIIPKKIEAKIKCEVPKVHSDVVPMFPEPTPKKMRMRTNMPHPKHQKRLNLCKITGTHGL